MLDENQIMNIAESASEYLIRNQFIPLENGRESFSSGDWGSFAFSVFPEGEELERPNRGPGWVTGFSSMACFAAHEAFGHQKYLTAAESALRHLKSLQVFSPFLPESYGAIREYSQLTSWSYIRDAVSVAWSFLNGYRYTKDEEYLERAIIFYKWFLKNGLDQYGYPLWGVILDSKGDRIKEPKMNQHLEGVFHGGTLNLFYQLFVATKDEKYIGEEYLNLADLVLERIQIADGSFATFDTNKMASVASDPQGDLHKVNDDMNTLGLLSVYKVTGEKKYLEAVQRFLNYVRTTYKQHGNFGPTRAGLPIALNIMHEYENLTGDGSYKTEVALILNELQSVQVSCEGSMQDGGILESEGKTHTMARSTQYTVIVLLKLLGYGRNILAVDEQ